MMPPSVLAAGRRPVRDVRDLDLRRREVLVHPLRLHRDVEQAHEAEARRHGHARHDVALAVAGHRDVDRELQRDVLGVLRALHELAAQAPVLEHVDLEDLRPVGELRGVLDVRRRDARQREDRAARVRRARGRALAFVVEQPLQRRRRAEERPVDLLAEQRRRHVDLRHVDERARQELVRVERRGVAPQRPFVVGRAVDVVEHRRGHVPARELAQLRDVVAALDTLAGHGVSLARRG